MSSLFSPSSSLREFIFPLQFDLYSQSLTMHLTATMWAPHTPSHFLLYSVQCSSVLRTLHSFICTLLLWPSLSLFHSYEAAPLGAGSFIAASLCGRKPQASWLTGTSDELFPLLVLPQHHCAQSLAAFQGRTLPALQPAFSCLPAALMQAAGISFRFGLFHIPSAIWLLIWV